jgi:hypothetical protein
MNKKIMIIIGVVIVVGVGVFFMMNNKAQAPTTKPTNNVVNNKLADDSDMAPKSLKDLLLKNEPVQCKYISEGTTGTFYVADKNIRSDMNILADGQTIINHMIVQDKVSYTWTEGAKTGFKIIAPEEEATIPAENKNSPLEQQSVIDMDKKMAYSCSPWEKDMDLFNLPSDVEFTDLNALVPTENKTNELNNETSLKAMQCAACDSSPAENRAQCKAALGCN